MLFFKYNIALLVRVHLIWVAVLRYHFKLITCCNFRDNWALVFFLGTSLSRSCVPVYCQVSIAWVCVLMSCCCFFVYNGNTVKQLQKLIYNKFTYFCFCNKLNKSERVVMELWSETHSNFIKIVFSLRFFKIFCTGRI